METAEVKNILTEEILIMLYISVGGDPSCREPFRIVLRNRPACFAAMENGKTADIARLTGDGGMSFYIKGIKRERQSWNTG